MCVCVCMYVHGHAVAVEVSATLEPELQAVVRYVKGALGTKLWSSPTVASVLSHHAISLASNVDFLYPCTNFMYPGLHKNLKQLCSSTLTKYDAWGQSYVLTYHKIAFPNKTHTLQKSAQPFQ